MLATTNKTNEGAHKKDQHAIFFSPSLLLCSFPRYVFEKKGVKKESVGAIGSEWRLY